MTEKPVYLVSACLLGLATRYDGRSKKCHDIHQLLADSTVVPVCPEQLGGLPTPRPAAELVGGDGYAVLAGRARVIDQQGTDVTKKFIQGAEQVLEIATLLGAQGFVLKAGSPSCGSGGVTGVLAALLRQKGFSCAEY